VIAVKNLTRTLALSVVIKVVLSVCATAGAREAAFDFVMKHSCEFNETSPAATFMVQFLKDKNAMMNAIRGRPEAFDARERAGIELANRYVLPSYLREHKILPDGAILDTSGAWDNNEHLICVRTRDGRTEAITQSTSLSPLTSRSPGSTRVMLYLVRSERGRLYLAPTQALKFSGSGRREVVVTGHSETWFQVHQ
jgi:hypothetical protein